MDILGLKARKIERQILDDLFQAKKKAKYIRNLERLKTWMDEQNANGIAMIQRYIENEGMPPPKTKADCDLLIKVLNHVA